MRPWSRRDDSACYDVAMSLPKPAARDFRRIVEESFDRQEMMQLLRAELTRVEAGEVEISMPFRREVTQQVGSVHAGAITAIADSACGYAALSLMPAGSEVVSVEFKLNLLAPAVAPRFVARARVVRAGNTLTVCNADVVGTSDDDAVLVAQMVGTFMRRTKK